MTEERRQRILDVADALEAEGLEATNARVYSRTLGHRGHITTVMKERRAQQAGGVAVADVDEDATEDETTLAATLQEDLTQLEHVYEAWHLALERLWEMEQEGPLTEAQFGRKAWLEYQMTANLQAQERLRPQLQAARTVEAVTSAQAHHDAAVPQSRVLVEQALQALMTAAHLWAQLGAQFDAQQTPLVGFRRRDGDQAFPWLGGGAVDAVNLFASLFPGDARAPEAFRLLQAPLTHGQVQGALRGCPRLSPFPPRAITTYLTTVTEGLNHA